MFGNVYNPFLYSGEYWDETSTLQYLRAHWYDPTMGRFINEDSYEGDISNPLSLNLYTYVSNNPLKYIDPTGHSQVQGTGGWGYSPQYSTEWELTTKPIRDMSMEELGYYYNHPNVSAEDKQRIAMYMMIHNVPLATQSALGNVSGKIGAFFGKLFSNNTQKVGSLVIEEGGSFSESEIRAAKYM